MLSDFEDRFFEEALAVLSHPIRRKILEYLWEKEYSFLELSNICERDHGKLGFHLRKMNGLVDRDPSRKVFQLTPKGRLMYEFLVQGLFNLQRATERSERTEHEVERFRNRFRTLFNTIPDLVGIIDSKGRIMAVNDRVEAVIGYKREELIGKNFLRTGIFSSKYKTILKEYFRAAIKGRVISPFELETLTKDGEHIAFEVVVERIEYGKKLAFLGVLRDITERKKMEEALGESEERYRTLVELAHDGILTTDNKLTITFVNKRMHDMLGYNPGELVGVSYLSLIPGEEKQDQRAKARLVKAGKRSIHERKLVRKDGTIITMLLSVSPRFDAKGNYVGGLGIFTDITEYKKAEEELKQSEKKLRDIVENLGACLTISDKNGIRTYANRTWTKMLGYTPEEMIGTRLPTFFHEESLARREVEYEKRKKGESSNYEAKYVSKDGRIVPALIIGSPILDENGGFAGSYSLVIDMTERKKLEKALIESERRYRTLVELAHDGILLTEGTERKITFTNPRMADMLGYTVDEFLGKRYPDLIHPDELEQALQSRKRRLARGETATRERRLIKKDGSTLHTLVSVSSPNPNDKAQTSPSLLIITDITERKRMEEALRESEERYRTLVESAHDGIIVSEGKQRTINFANPRMADMLGYTIQELVGMSYSDLVHPDDMSDYRSKVKNHIKKSWKGDIYERRLIRKDGSTLHTLVSTTSIASKDKTATASSLNIFTDISELKHAENVLRESETRFRALAEASFEAIVIHEKGKILETNSAFADLYGYESSEIGNMDVLSLTAPRFRGIVSKYILSGYEKPYESYGLRKDGTVFPVEVRGAPILYKGRTVRVAAIRDITEWKRITEKSRKLDEELR